MSLRVNMRRVWFGAICVGVIALATSAYAVTDRHVEGVITAVDATSVTIQGQHAVTARIDQRTKIHVDGKVAKLSDLQVTQSARADMNLDEAWADIEAKR